MNNKSTVIFVFIGLLLVAGLCFTFVKILTPKIVYVKSGDLITKFEGMKEAKDEYKQKMSKWQANIDTLESDYRRSISNYQLNMDKYSSAQKTEKENTIKKQADNIKQYAMVLEEKAKEEDQKMTQSVLTQVNTFVEEYGEKNGYDIILGLTNYGNVMYGTKSKDITEVVLADMNKWYKGKQSK